MEREELTNEAIHKLEKRRQKEKQRNDELEFPSAEKAEQLPDSDGEATDRAEEGMRLEGVQTQDQAKSGDEVATKTGSTP